MDIETHHITREDFKLLKSGLLLFGSVVFAFNATIVLHEFGHAIAMWATGTGVAEIVIHPFSRSHCVPASTFTHPTLLFWAGTVLGSLMGLMLAALAWRWRGPFAMPAIMTGVFSCLHNGIYLFYDGALGTSGDATLLILCGTPSVLIFFAGSLMIGVGILLGFMCLPLLDIRPAESIRARATVFAGGILAYAAVSAVQLAIRGVGLHWWILFGIILSGLILFAAATTKLLESRVPWFKTTPTKTVNWPAVGLANLSGFVFLSTLLILGGRDSFQVEKFNPKVDYVAQINELAKAGRPEHLNAAPYYEKATELYAEAPAELDMKTIGQWPSDLSAGQLRLWKEWVESNFDALEQLRKGARKPHYWRQHRAKSSWEVEFFSLEVLRELAFAILLRAKLSVIGGRIEDAVKDITVCYRCGLHMRSSMLLTEQLMGIAISARAVKTALLVLKEKGAGKALLEELQSRMERHADEQPSSFDLRVAKFRILDAIQWTFTDDGKGDGRIRVGAAARVLSSTGMVWDYLEREDILRFYGLRRRQTIEAVERVFEHIDHVLEKTPWELEKESIFIDGDLLELMDRNLFVMMLLPGGISHLASLSARCKTDTAGLITVLALLRYKDDHGQFPANLQGLVSAGYLKKWPMDPFSGKPLVYRRIVEGFTLYSFGVDFDDDGGKPSKWGGGEEGGDQVFWPPQILLD